MTQEFLSGLFGACLPIILAVLAFFINRRIIKTRNATALLLEILVIEDRLSLTKPEVVGGTYNSIKIKYSPTIVDISNFQSLVYAGNLSFYNDTIRMELTKFYKTINAHNEITKKLTDVQGELELHDKSKTHYVKVAVPLELVLTQLEVKINNLLSDIKNNVDEQKSFF